MGAHHLKATKNNSSLSLLLLNGTIELYNLANNWQQQQQQQQHSQISSNYVTDDDSDYDDEDDMILSMDDDKDTNSCSSSSTSSYYSVRFNTILYNNLNHLKQLLFAMNINNNRNFDTFLTERRLDYLISSVRTHIVTCDDDEESNFMEEEEDDNDLEFKYFNEKEMKKYSPRDDVLVIDNFSSSRNTVRRTSSSIPFQNVRCAYAA